MAGLLESAAIFLRDQCHPQVARIATICQGDKAGGCPIRASRRGVRTCVRTWVLRRARALASCSDRACRRWRSLAARRPVVVISASPRDSCATRLPLSSSSAVFCASDSCAHMLWRYWTTLISRLYWTAPAVLTSALLQLLIIMQEVSGDADAVLATR